MSGGLFPSSALATDITPTIAHLPMRESAHLVLLLCDTLGNDSAGTVVALFHVLLDRWKGSARSCLLKLRGTPLGQGNEARGAVLLTAN